MDLFVSAYVGAMDNVVVNSLLMNNSGKMHFFRGAARLVRLETPKLSRLSGASPRLAGRPAVSSKTGQLCSVARRSSASGDIHIPHRGFD